MNFLGRFLTWLGKVTQLSPAGHNLKSHQPQGVPEVKVAHAEAVDEKPQLPTAPTVNISEDNISDVPEALPLPNEAYPLDTPVAQTTQEIEMASTIEQGKVEKKMSPAIQPPIAPSANPIRPVSNPKPRRLPPKPNKSFTQLVAEIRQMLDKYDPLLSASELENALIDALWYTDYVGELPIEREMFEVLAKWLQRLFNREGKLFVKQVSPAIFVVSMVFSARYSDDDTRQFWQSYAHRVWGSEPTQSFTTRCRDRFVDAVKVLEKVTHMDFPISRGVTVDFYVHRHALVPAYLEDDVARWLKKHLK